MYEIKYRSKQELKTSSIEWLGEIPDEWELTRIKFLSTLNDEVLGENTKKSYLFKYVDIGNVTFENGIENYQEVTFGKAPSRARRKVRVGDTIISTVRTYLKAIARIQTDDRVVVSTGFAVIRPRTINETFLNYALKQSYLLAKIAADSKGVSYPAINAIDIVNFKIGYPSTGEQQKIANFLDIKTALFDNITFKKEQLIEKLEEAKKSLISEVVTGKVKIVDGELVERQPEEMKDSGVEWLGMIPNEWGVSKLKYKCITTKGYAFKIDLFVENGHPVIRASDLKNNSITSAKIFINKAKVKKYYKVALRQGDIVMSTVGSTPDVVNSAVGQISRVPNELDGALLNQNTVILRKKNSGVTYDYLYNILRANKFRKFLDLHAHGTANQASLTLKEILEFPIVFPKAREQETAIKFISEKEESICKITKDIKDEIQKLKKAKQSLISEAVTGKIDLRDWEIQEVSDAR